MIMSVGTRVSINPYRVRKGTWAILISGCVLPFLDQTAGYAVWSGLAWKMCVLTGQYCNESQPDSVDILLIKSR